MYSGTTVPKVKNIYIYSKKKRKKKEGKISFETSCTGTTSTCTGTTCSKTGSSKLVPVQLNIVPVQLNKKLAVAKLYRYNLNLYRYNRSEIGQRGFLNQKIGRLFSCHMFLPFHKLSPSRVFLSQAFPRSVALPRFPVSSSRLVTCSQCTNVVSPTTLY